jgi:sugar lactone lactonase YvrE
MIERNNRPLHIYIYIALALVASIGFWACANALLGLEGQAATNRASFPVTVSWEGSSPAVSRTVIFDDGTVDSVMILVYSSSTGERIGSGPLARRPATSDWGGTINVSENVSAVFEATVFNATGAVLYVGRMTQTLTGTNDSVTITVGLAGSKSGSIQGYVPTLSARVNTFAGTAGIAGTGTDLLPGRFTNPYQITSDGTNLYVADMGANNIRKIVLATQAVSTFAGDVSGAAGGRNDGGYGTATRFNNPRGITLYGDYLYVTDYSNHAIRRITISSGLVESYAGTLGAAAGATENAAADAALFNGPSGITTDGVNLYVADTGNNKIRKIVIASSNGTRTVSTLSGLTGGVGTAGAVDGLGTGAQFSGPQGVATDGTNVYIADTGNNLIRQIRISDGWTSTIAGSGAAGSIDDATGTSASFYGPTGITTDGTYLYVADTTSNKIRRVTIAAPNAVITLAGAGTVGTANGLGTAATFSGPSGITTDGSNLYVSDYSASTIRKIQ